MSNSFTPHCASQIEITTAPALGRRRLITGSAAMAGLAALEAMGFPAIVHAQSDKIRIGHLTPRTGFLGPLGETGHAMHQHRLTLKGRHRAHRLSRADRPADGFVDHLR